MNILIIEDEKRNFNRLKRLLEEMDYTLRIDGPTTSIAETVDRLRRHPAPDLVRDVNHIFSENKLTCLCLTDGTQEVVSLSMDALEAQLNPDEFFRANRQYIVRIDCVEYVGNYFNAKLIVRLKGYPKVEVIVSREKAAAFKAWMDR